MKYESLLEKSRAKDKTEEHWRVCPTCWDSFLGTPGEECLVCGGVTQRAPLMQVCDACGWAVSGEITMIGRFKICERCMRVKNDEEVLFMAEWERAKIKRGLRRAEAITELMEVRNGNP